MANALPNKCLSTYSDPSPQHLEIQSEFQEFLLRYKSSLPALPEYARDRIFNALFKHPVAGLDQLGIYDPNGIIGFCFGRSFAAFLLERQMGLKISAIKNLFIVGDLRSGQDPEWRFHVTNVVQLSNGQWYAIDPVIPQNRPVPVAEWVRTVRSIWDKKGRAKLYATSPMHILPDIRNMATPDKELGLDLIDLSFDPSAKLDILTGQVFGKSLAGETYFEIQDSGHPYFLQVHADKSGSFSFDKLTVNGTDVSYNNFFADLMKSVLNPFASPMSSMQTMSTSNEPKQTVHPASYGMIFGPEFYKKPKGARR
jgi:hypothetical protein